MYFNKIDKTIFNTVKFQENKNDNINCIVYANNYISAKNYLINKLKCNVKEYPFIKAFGINASINNIKILAQKSHVKYISSNAKVFAQMNKTREVMKICDVQKQFKGNGVTVAVIDTGINESLDFCSFKNRILCFKDFVNKKIEPYDDNGHGTFVAGVLCGNGFLSGKKFCGVAPNCNIIMCKALDSNGETGALTILEAMQWIYDHKEEYNIKVVCMSFGSQPLQNGDPLMLGAESLWNEGIVVVAAAGNSGPDQCTIKSPGVSGKIITVGALDDCRDTEKIDINKFKVADFSSRGPAFKFYKPDCIACGVDIISCCNNNDEFYTNMSGTSVATPIVAGCCALLLEKYPNLSPMSVKNKILKSCHKLTNDRNADGFGYLDASMLCDLN